MESWEVSEVSVGSDLGYVSFGRDRIDLGFGVLDVRPFNLLAVDFEPVHQFRDDGVARSEERRVGKECRL